MAGTCAPTLASCRSSLWIPRPIAIRSSARSAHRCCGLWNGSRATRARKQLSHRRLTTCQIRFRFDRNAIVDADLEHQHIDPRLVLLHRAAARLTLFECGELDLDEASEDIVVDDWTFWRACDRSDQRARQRVEDPNLARLRRLLDDDVSLDRACAALNSNRPT